MEFEHICKLLNIDLSKRPELLKALATCAVLVRGLWIVKSELLYPTNTFSATNGVPSELMCRSRDYVVSTSPPEPKVKIVIELFFLVLVIFIYIF